MSSQRQSEDAVSYAQHVTTDIVKIHNDPQKTILFFLSSSRRTQRPVESTLPVHVLPILGLLLLAHTSNIVARHLFVLCRSEPSKAHHGLHGRHVVVLGVHLVSLGGVVAARRGLFGDVEGHVGVWFALDVVVGAGAGWKGCCVVGGAAGAWRCGATGFDLVC